MQIPNIVWQHFVTGASRGTLHLSENMWIIFKLSGYNPLLGTFLDPGQLVFEEERGAFPVEEGYFLPSIIAEDRYPELRKKFNQQEASVEAFRLSWESYADWKTFSRFWGYRDLTVEAYYKGLRVYLHEDPVYVDTRTKIVDGLCLDVLYESAAYIQNGLRELDIFNPEVYQFCEMYEPAEIEPYVMPSDVYIPDEMELGYAGISSHDRA